MGEYTISKHAKERYAERILNIQDKLEINRYIIENEDKICKDINKMITYGVNIYTGKNIYKDRFVAINNNSNISLFVSNTWVVLVNADASTVITLFRKDLELGDEEFNKLYMEKLIARFNELHKLLVDTQLRVEEKNVDLRQVIKDNTDKIATYRGYIKTLEEANVGLKAIMESNFIEVKEAEEKFNSIMEKLMTK